jgi:hypothetical protein
LYINKLKFIELFLGWFLFAGIQNFVIEIPSKNRLT